MSREGEEIEEMVKVSRAPTDNAGPGAAKTISVQRYANGIYWIQNGSSLTRPVAALYMPLIHDNAQPVSQLGQQISAEIGKAEFG